MPKKPFEQLAARQKQKIYKISLELLANNGYDRTSIKMITKRLKVADGYLHYYFYGKEDLVKWALENGLDSWMDHFRVHVEQRHPKDLYELYKYSIAQMIRFTRTHHDLFAAYMRLVDEPHTALAKYLYEKISWIDKLYIKAIEDEMNKGTLRSDVPAPLIAAILDVINTRFQEYCFNPGLDPIGVSKMDDSQVNELTDKVLSILRHGLNPQPAD